MFDLLVALVLIVSAAAGFFRGATRELVSVMSLIVAVFASVFLLRFTGPLFAKAIATDWIAKAMALLVTFLVLYAVCRIAGAGVTNRVRDVQGLNSLDRAIGVGFGLIRALVVLGVFNLVFHAATPPERTPSWVIDAKLYPLTAASGRMLLALAPKGEAIVDKVAPALGGALDGDPIGDILQEKNKAAAAGDPIGDLIGKTATHRQNPDSTRDKQNDPGYDPGARKNLDDLVEKSR